MRNIFSPYSLSRTESRGLGVEDPQELDGLKRGQGSWCRRVIRVGSIAARLDSSPGIIKGAGIPLPAPFMLIYRYVSYD